MYFIFISSFPVRTSIKRAKTVFSTSSSADLIRSTNLLTTCAQFRLSQPGDPAQSSKLLHFMIIACNGHDLETMYFVCCSPIERMPYDLPYFEPYNYYIVLFSVRHSEGHLILFTYSVRIIA